MYDFTHMPSSRLFSHMKPEVDMILQFWEEPETTSMYRDTQLPTLLLHRINGPDSSDPNLQNKPCTNNFEDPTCRY